MCSSTTVKFMKSVSLIIDAGTQALSYRLKQEVQNSGYSSLNNFLIHHKHKLFHLHEKKNCCQCGEGQANRTIALTNHQWSMLFIKKLKSCNKKKPCLCQYEPQENVSEDDFDLSLLGVILLNVCSLDPAESQDIKNLKQRRNISFHSKNAQIDDTSFERELLAIKDSIESITNRCGEEVHLKVKREIENVMKSQLNDNMCRFVLSSLHVMEERAEEISQYMKDIRAHLEIREELTAVSQRSHHEPSRQNAKSQGTSSTSSETKLYKRDRTRLTTNADHYQKSSDLEHESYSSEKRPENCKYEKIITELNEACHNGDEFQYFVDKIFETCTFLSQTNNEGCYDVDFAVENENFKIVQTLSMHKGKFQSFSPETSIFQTLCKKGYTQVTEYILKKYPYILEKIDSNGWNAAHSAAQGGHVKILQILLEKGVRCDKTTIGKETILHIACLHARYEMCQFILSKFPDMLSDCDEYGQNAAFFAALGGNIQILQFLIDRGVQNHRLNNASSTILHAACGNAHYEMSQYILSRFPDMLDLVNKDGWNAAHWGARGGNVKILQMLIQKGVQIKITRAKRNALHIACQYAHFEMCHFILSNFPAMSQCEDEDGWKAIHFAAQGGNVNILQMLLEKGARENQITFAKKSLLHIACASAQYDMCEYILSNFPGMLHMTDAVGRNAAHFAAQGGNVNFLQLLLKKDVQAKHTTIAEKNILHIACENDRYSMCKTILSYFPDMLHDVDKIGRNAAHCAACGENVNILQLLIDKGVQANQTIIGKINLLQIACSYAKYKMCHYILSKYPEMLHLFDGKGWSAAHYAALEGHVHILKRLVKRGIDANHCSKSGMSILHIASANARYEMCQYILCEFPNMLHVKDIRGWNATHYAALKDNLDILKLLIKKGLSINQNPDEQENILHIACAYASSEMCQYILSNDPDTLNLISKDGWNAAHWAARRGNVKILQLLLEKGVKSNETTYDEENILDIACANAQYDMCEYIISAFKDTFHFDDEDKQYAPFWAAHGGSVDILKLLMDNGVQVNQTTSGNINILHVACSNARLQMCQYVLTKFPYMLNCYDNNGWNAAHFAAQGGNVKILKLLLKKNKQIHQTTYNKQNILHIACANGKYEMFQYIISEFRDMLHDVDEEGWNAALWAAHGGNVKILQELITEKSLSLPISAKMNMLQVACAHAQFEMCKHILSEFPEMLHFVTKDGWNTAHYAAQGGNVDILKLILEKGVKGEPTTHDGKNILHIACLNGKYQMCQFIEKRYPAMKFEFSKYGRNALYYAAVGKNDPIVQFLIFKGVHLI